MTAQALIDLVHDHDRLRRDIVDLSWDRDRLRRENDELRGRLRSINPVLVENQPGTTMAMILARVVASVASRHGITIQKLRRGGRSRDMARIRSEAAWECRQVTPCPSLREIGRAVGLGDHSSVISAIGRHEKSRLQASTPSPSNPAGTGGAPASPVPSLPVPAGCATGEETKT